MKLEYLYPHKLGYIQSMYLTKNKMNNKIVKEYFWFIFSSFLLKLLVNN